MNINGPKPGQDPKYSPNPHSSDPKPHLPNTPPENKEPIIMPDPTPSLPNKDPNLPLEPDTSSNSSFAQDPSLGTVKPDPTLGTIKQNPLDPSVSDVQPHLQYSEEWRAQAEREQQQRERIQQEEAQKRSSTAGFEEKMGQTFKSFKDSKKVDEMYNYARENTMDTIAYVFLILGIILLFVNPLLGGFIVGVIAGIYFSQQIYDFIQSTRQIFEREERTRYIILAGVLISLLLAAPGFFVGAILAVAVKQIILKNHPEDKSDIDKNNDKNFRNRL